MTRYFFLAFTNAKEARDDEFNDWYDNIHLADVLKVPGIVAAQRFRVADGDTPLLGDHRYLAIYEVDAPDVKSARKTLADSGVNWFFTDAFERNGVQAAYFVPIGERMTEDDVA